jgi:fructan beta-fructosidase
MPENTEPLAEDIYRPLYHYTPVRNFMNDPNGLVYHQGEYHLFHQYNPFGNSWGHMSWNHAVSRDLVHWQPLPVALHEEAGVMVYSGSAVADPHNTSGFGTAKNPPLVAIYTGHRVADEMESQCLAYSVDKGRTWTKCAANPVLTWERDFRDPKVFWYPPTEAWVMVVTKATEKKLRFYGSKDLKTWTHLSEFGPAGVPAGQKANWECPDLFPVPIEGETGKRKWVLHVGMGDGHVNGGSGGEYFIGEFDGTTFHNDNPAETVLWADYGKDDYAAVSWSGATGPHGEACWIGWMSNWRYANVLPTTLWRNALTVPRLLSLRRFAEGLRLVQRPVPQLERLRGERREIGRTTVTAEHPLVPDRAVWGDALEIIAEFEPGTAAEFGLTVRSGGDEKTRVGYDAAAKRLFIDRTHSGRSDFHADFAGRHSGPMRTLGKRVMLHILVDRCSVEVFGNHGETVLSELIFPQPSSQGLSVYAVGGDVHLIRLEIWKLKPAV